MKVRVYTDYSPAKILHGVSGKSFVDVSDELAAKVGLVGNFVDIDESEIPKDRKYRSAWKIEGKKVEIDQIKMQAIDEKASK